MNTNIIALSFIDDYALIWWREETLLSELEILKFGDSDGFLNITSSSQNPKSRLSRNAMIDAQCGIGILILKYILNLDPRACPGLLSDVDDGAFTYRSGQKLDPTAGL